METAYLPIACPSHRAANSCAAPAALNQRPI